MKKLSISTGRIAIAASVAIGLAVAPSSAAFAVTGIANTGAYVICSESDAPAVFSITTPVAGDIIAVTFFKHDALPSYLPLTYVGHLVIRDSAVAEDITVTVADAATWAQQAGITDWPLEIEVNSYPAGTTDFQGTNSTSYDYADFGLVSSSPGSYDACTKPELAQSGPSADELPATGTNTTGSVVTGFVALALLTAGGVALAVRRRRTSL